MSTHTTRMIKLITPVPVSGRLRYPHEGLLHLTADDAQRLLDDQAGEDVTGDFTAEQLKELPVEHVTVETGTGPAKEPPHRHQSELAPAPADVEEPRKPAARGKAADKE
ncbi:MAG TPA: hypothetical protein VM662_09230 [Sphingomonas sp.]|nr:hypothetical protein [Sphingomonas sp.]